MTPKSEQLRPIGHGVCLQQNVTAGLNEGEKGSVNEFFTTNYDSMRQLVERKERELEDIREFADFERQTLKAQLQEQEIEMKSYSTESEPKSIGNIGTNAISTISKVGCSGLLSNLLEVRKSNNDYETSISLQIGLPVKDPGSSIQQLRFEQAQCKADLKMIRDNKIEVGLPIVEAEKSWRRRCARDVMIMDLAL